MRALFLMIMAWAAVASFPSRGAAVGLGYLAVEKFDPGDPWERTVFFESGDEFIYSKFICRGDLPPVVIDELCDDADLPPDFSVLISVHAKVFPFIDMTVAFTDYGDPSPLTVAFGLPIPAMTGPARAMLSGFVTTPGGDGALFDTNPALAAPPTFFAGRINDRLVLALGDGPLPQGDAPRTTLFGPVSTGLACGGMAPCDFLTLVAGLNGLGGGQTTTFGARFDVDPVAPVPLPAGLPLLVAGLGLLGLMRRPRQTDSP